MTDRHAIETCNAVIRSARILIERGMLTTFIGLDFGDYQQGFGGYRLLPGPHSECRRRCELGPNYGALFVERVMRIADVDEWDRLVGKAIRVRRNGGDIIAIGHIVKEDWFEPRADFEALAQADAKARGEAP